MSELEKALALRLAARLAKECPRCGYMRDGSTPSLLNPGCGHFIERCVCGRVLAQCRCPGPKEERVKSGPCACSGAGKEPPR